jgi:hypothetical protein
VAVAEQEKQFIIMKNIISKLFILSISLFLVACDKGEAFYHQWEGEYITKQTMEVVYGDGTTETYDFSSRELPLNIFQDRGLYVQTYGIGDPYIPGVDLEEHVLRLKSPKYTNMTIDSIDNVVVTNPKPYIIIIDGHVFTLYNGVQFSPKPICVTKATSDKLILANGSSFEVIVTDLTGNQVDVNNCHWEYSPIQKQNEVYTWDVELHANSKNKLEQPSVPIIFRTHFVIRKK